MEYKRKKITDAEILSFENEMVEKCNAIFEEKKAAFSSIGYELDLEIYWENEKTYDTGNFEQERDYVNGYSSKAAFRVLKKEETEVPEELYQANDEGSIPVSEEEKEVRRRVAYTTVSLVRIYKSFWSETVSLEGDVSCIVPDLNEFFEKLQNNEQ